MADPAPTHADLIAYVAATARLQALPLDTAQIERVAGHLTRTRVLAELLQAAPLSPHDEPAELFCPAPFPAEDAP